MTSTCACAPRAIPDRSPPASKGFRRYQESDAWTWEHMALTRARVIAGDRDFAADCSMTLRRILSRPRDPVKLAGDVAIHAPAHGPAIPDRPPVGREAPGRRAGRYRIHRPVPDPAPRRRAPGSAGPQHRCGALAALGRAGIIAGGGNHPAARGLELWRNLHGFLRITVGSGLDEARSHPASPSAWPPPAAR